MKHLKLALEEHNEQVALEGILDKIEDSFHALRNKLFYAPDVAERSLQEQDRKVKALLSKLQDLRVNVTKSTMDTSRRIKVAELLKGIASKVDTGAQVIAALEQASAENKKKIEAYLTKLEHARQHPNEPLDLKSLARDRPASDPVSGEVVFSKAQILVLIDLGIDQCKHYQAVRQKHKLQLLGENKIATESEDNSNYNELQGQLGELGVEIFHAIEHLFRILTVVLKIVFTSLKIAGQWLVAGMDLIVAFFDDLTIPNQYEKGYR